MEITSRQLKHDRETSPRDFKELRTDTYQIHSNNQIIIITHSNLMSTFVTTFHSYSMLNPCHLILRVSWI